MGALTPLEIEAGEWAAFLENRPGTNRATWTLDQKWRADNPGKLSLLEAYRAGGARPVETTDATFRRMIRHLDGYRLLVSEPPPPAGETVALPELQAAIDELTGPVVLRVLGGQLPRQLNIRDRLAPLELVAADLDDPPIFNGDGQRGYPAVFVYRSVDVTLGRGLVYRNPAGKGVLVWTCRRTRVEGGRFASNGEIGLLVQDDAVSGDNEDVDVVGNEFFGNGWDITLDSHTAAPGTGCHSLYYGGGTGRTLRGRIENNWIRDSKNGQAVQIGPAAIDLVVAHNTIQRVPHLAGVDPARENAIGVFTALQDSRGTQIRGNVIEDVAGYAVVGASMGGATAPYAHAEGNAARRCGLSPAFQPLYGSARPVSVGPNWTSPPEVADWKLSPAAVPAADSPLVGRADPAWLPAVDFHGRPRTRRTLGAFEPA